MDLNLFQQLIFFLIIIIAIVFHEYAHAWSANQQGDDTAKRAGRLTLNPIPHIDPIGSILFPLVLVLMGSSFLFGWAKPVPYNPALLRNLKWGDALVAIAGPAANILLALIAAIIFRIFGPLILGFDPTLASSLLTFFYLVVFINILLALFNLIPIPPLDGSKLLSTFLPEAGRKLFMILERFGPIFIFLILIFTFSLIAPFLGQLIDFLTRLFMGV